MGHYISNCGILIYSLPLIFGGNLVGAAFTGMEHSLQLLVALALVSGLISFCQTGKYSRWLPAAIVLAPLVRYEMLALSAPAIWILCRNKKVKSATILFLCMAGLLCGFSFFLHSVCGFSLLESL